MKLPAENCKVLIGPCEMTIFSPDHASLGVPGASRIGRRRGSAHACARSSSGSCGGGRQEPGGARHRSGRDGGSTRHAKLEPRGRLARCAVDLSRPGRRSIGELRLTGLSASSPVWSMMVTTCFDGTWHRQYVSDPRQNSLGCCQKKDSCFAATVSVQENKNPR
jgi:hypothetical protein